MKTRISIIVLSALFVFGVATYQFFSIYDGKIHVIFCDVGQGDGIYIRTPRGIDILVDAGRDEKILKCLSNNMPFWDKTIELAFATHPDADHIGGFVYVLDSYTVKSYNTVNVEKNTGIFGKINNSLKKQNIKIKYLTRGDKYVLPDGVKITTYWPTNEFIETGDKDTNRYSLVQLIKYKNFDTLLTGDIDFDILNEIIFSNQNNLKNVDVFKLSHHGSRTGLDSQTLTLINPKIAIISAGKNNSYGHPHKEVMQELNIFNLKYVRTDQHGEIEFVSPGEGFSLE